MSFWLGAVPSASAQLDLSFQLPGIGNTAFSATNTTIFRYRGDNYDANLFDDDFASLFERLDLALQSDELRVEARLDTFVPFVDGVTTDAPACAVEGDTRCYLTWDLRPERFAVRWQPGDWTLEAGDSQIVFGRGLALSFRKVDLLGIDNALRGGHVRYESTNIRFGVHAGVANPQNQDPIDLSIIREREDVVAGATFAVTTPGDTQITVGGHALRVQFEDDIDARSARDNSCTRFCNIALDIAGWSMEAPALADGALSFYVEANGMRRSYDLREDPHTQGGHALYANVQLQTENLTVLFEWKDYTNFLVAPSVTEDRTWRIYNAAPAVEFNGPQRLRGIGNQRGGGLLVNYAFLPGPWQFSVNTVLYGYHEEPQFDPWDGWIVSHSWLRLQKRQEYGGDLNWSFDFTGGARFEILNHELAGGEFGPGDLDRWMIHGQAEVSIGAGDHSVEINVDHRHERQLIGGQIDEFQIGGASVTYSFGVPLVLSLSVRWTDFQQGIVDLRARKDYNFLGGEIYPSLEARYVIEPGTYFGLFVGQTPGGQICSGGVCRNVPTFEGIRLTFVGRL